MTQRRAHAAAAVLCLAAVAGVLAAMGRVWWCEAGDWRLWSGQVASRHNSQHPLDPYAFTHVLHGLLLYPLARLLGRGWAAGATRAWIAFALESAWEVLENTEAAIQRYRTATMSLDYYGDSVVNSLGDIVTCMGGYFAAGVLPVWASVAAFVAIDGALAWWIRDGLLLNVLMLVHPVEAVKQWQLRGRNG